MGGTIKHTCVKPLIEQWQYSDDGLFELSTALNSRRAHHGCILGGVQSTRREPQSGIIPRLPVENPWRKSNTARNARYFDNSLVK
jgi:hypothetical protein